MRLLLLLILAFFIVVVLLPEENGQQGKSPSKENYKENNQQGESPPVIPKKGSYKPVILDAKVLSEVGKDEFFVSLKVDAYELAKLTFKYTCNHPAFFSAGTKQCSSEELSEKIQEALSEGYYLSLYGKYRNSWVLFNNENEIPGTLKFGGHSVSEFKRSQNNIDSIILGPIPEKPTKVLIQIYNKPDKEDANFDENFSDPMKYIKN
jgi:hypothetical protein